MNNLGVALQDVCFSYETEMVLKHLSLQFNNDRICFVMGNNGSGKTTLLKTIMGFLHPQAGKVLIDDFIVAKLDRKTMSRRISYVPQAIHLNTDFLVIDYLSLGRTPYVGLVSRLQEEDYAIIERFAQRLGVSSFYGTPFNKLSGGQKQLVAIARSLIQDTPIIIMDEPMSALDIGKQVDLLDTLDELAKEGKTIILTTHNPNHALSVDCDSCLLKDGEVVAFGDSNAIIDKILLNKVFGSNIILKQSDGHRMIGFNTRTINNSK